MSEDVHRYEIGEWVVHSSYGVGQIKQLEKVPLHGDPQKKEMCYKVQTREGVFWFPVDQHDNPRVRPIITEKKLISSLETFKEPPRRFGSTSQRAESTNKPSTNRCIDANYCPIDTRPVCQKPDQEIEYL